MKVDVLIEYNKTSSEVTFSSKAARFTQTRPARIGLSRPKSEKYETELIEFVGEDWESIKNIPDLFKADPSRKDRTFASLIRLNLRLLSLMPYSG